jgi:hypothetical protein
VDTQPRHIQDMVIGNPNTLSKDRHPLWRDFNTHKYERPFNHGVVGPQFEVPLADDNRGFNHIASPMPRPQVARRIYPNELPPVTYSPTSFDMPMRKDVVQVDIPEATIRTTEENIDPRFPPKRPVAKVTGTLYHGTGSNDVSITHGLPTFLEKKAKNRKNKNKKKNKARKNKKISKKSHKRHHNLNDGACTPDPIISQTQNAKSQGLANARHAEERATHMIDSITNNLAGENKMILNVDLVNRYEQPDIRIHEHNRSLERNLREIRNTEAGVRSAHTYSKLY